MVNYIVIHLCPLCGEIGIVNPVAPDPLYPETSFLNRCHGDRLTNERRNVRRGSGSQKGSDRTTVKRDASKKCRFPFADQNGTPIVRKSEYREALENGTPVADIVEMIFRDNPNADRSIYYILE